MVNGVTYKNFSHEIGILIKFFFKPLSAKLINKTQRGYKYNIVSETLFSKKQKMNWGSIIWNKYFERYSNNCVPNYV